ncbi:MAG: C39 family peptidase [Clostridia bacterium]|nr:C39 family peptidase [Clostridia bacterium]
MAYPLQYQLTEYDCGPTSVINALRLLFDRKLLHPDMIHGVYRYCMEGFNCHGEMGKTGTSRCAMHFLSQWFNQYAMQRHFPIHTEYLVEGDTYLHKGSPIEQTLRAGGCALVRCHFGCEHYILLTGLCEDGEHVYVFDPYYLEKKLRRRDIVPITDLPCRANVMLPFDRLNREDRDYYAMGSRERRECVLFFNTAATQMPDLQISCAQSAAGR